MTNPLNLIKQGILEGNLDKVAEGFNLMTGEKVQPGVDSAAKVLKIIQQHIENYYSKHKQSNAEAFVPEYDEVKSNTIQETSKVITSEQPHIKLVDALDELSDAEKEQIVKDKPKRGRRKKTRPPKEHFVTNKCIQCGKEFVSTVHEELCKECLKSMK